MLVYYIEVLEVLFVGEYSKESYAEYISFIRPYTMAIGVSILVNISYSLYFLFVEADIANYTRPRFWGQFFVPIAANILAFYALSSVTFVMC